MLLFKKDRPQGPYDVVVIGSGLGGMTAANMLGRQGHKVLLLEAHNKLGGLATWFRRPDGKIFDISLHGFPAGMIKTCRRYWNADIANRIVRIKKVRFKNPQFDLETDFTEEDYKRILHEKFGLSSQVAQGFFDALREMNFYDRPETTIGELFNNFFPGRNDIVRFLLEPITYANGSTLEDPAIAYGIVFSNFMNKGVYIFQGGTDLMIELMKTELLKNGVDIKLHSEVEKILIENGKVVGVQAGGETIGSRAVVSNAHLLSTIFKLVGPEHFSPDFQKTSEQVRPNTSSCQVYMGLKQGESIPYMGDLIFCSKARQFSTEMLLNPAIEGQTFSFYYPEMRPHREQTYAVVSSSNARYEDWANLSSEIYQKRKQHLIDRALADLEELVPGVGRKIDFAEAATPLTLERFTRHPMGASFGTKFEGLEASKKLSEEIAGLYHAGSVGIIMSGWLGAANYGAIQSHAVNTYLSLQEGVSHDTIS
ncbi:MAG: phytoene dehydrogenase [Bdellovibrionales bacterium GWA2_49_15]|nr:MAG: phytoene dehydrogenase [Bdellovibrionales bacterium GWA2_49_15]